MSWEANAVELGSGFTERGRAGVESDVAGEAGCGVAARRDDGSGGGAHRARRGGSLVELGLRLDEAKQLTAALQAQLVPAQVAMAGECRRCCEACGRVLASKGYYPARFRSLFGDVPVRVRRLLMLVANAVAGSIPPL